MGLLYSSLRKTAGNERSKGNKGRKGNKCRKGRKNAESFSFS